MAKNIQIRFDQAGTWVDLFPNTKAELVEGLQTMLDSKVTVVSGKGLSTNDFSSAEKTKLAGIDTGANKYTHPSGDGNLHVPVTGTSNDGKVLKAGATAGSVSWSSLTSNDIPQLALSKIADAGSAASLNVGVASGNIPVLDTSGKLNASVLPAIAISDTFEASSEALMLALTAQRGDMAIRSDLGETFVLSAEPATTLANWKKILTPTSAVQSVAGRVGVVVLTKSDVGLGSVENYGIATETEAVTGTVPNKLMTPQRTKQAIDSAITTANASVGDMKKSVYDTDNSGKVGVAKVAEAVAWTGVTNKPTASTSVQGIVQLNNTTTSTSTSQAATANAVKVSYDLASSKTRIVLSPTAPTDANIWYQEIT